MPQYQGVWTLEQQAQAQSNQQWVTDPNFKNTTLLLQADGTGSGSQNQTFLDGSTNNFFITRNGNTTQGSFSPFSQAPGYWGNYFDGSGDYISMPSATSALALGSGDWTVECFVNLANYSDNRTLIDIYDGDSSVRFIWRILTTGLLAFQGASGATRTSTTTTVPTNQWVHLAICKASGTTRIFINGIQSNTNYTDTNTYTNSGASAIGIISSDFSSSPYLGYISNFRVVKGTALYAANFNPPTSTLTAVTNTSLLTCQSNRFVDNSASPLTLTLGGTPSIQAFGPFAPALQWTPDVVGGSGYFDGTADYLATATSSNFVTSGDFTMEAWAYNTGRTNDYQGIIVQRSASGGPSINTNNTGILEFSFGGTVMTTATMPVNQWFHVAMSRSGSGSNNISMYLNGTRIAQATNTGSTVTNNLVVGRYYTDVDNYYWLGYIASTRYTTSSIYSGATITVPTVPVTAVANTQLLLNYTNAGIYDGKMANNLETVGNAQVATAPVKYGSGSMYFDGTGDYLTIPFSQNVVFNAGNFTIEGWVYAASTSARQSLFCSPTDGATFNGIELDINSGNFEITASVSSGTWTILFATAGAISAATWTHFALVRNGTNLTMYVNGIQTYTSTALGSNALVSGTTPATISLGRFGTDTRYLNGYMDDFRITKLARYFTTFTPPQQALPRQ